jgi:hypothetical protein
MAAGTCAGSARPGGGAPLFIAVVRGLLLDRLGSTDPERTDEALERFATLLGRRRGRS